VANQVNTWHGPARESELAREFRLDRILSKLGGAGSVWVLPALAAYAGLRSLAYAARKPFWFDELLTRIVCRQGNAAGILDALKRGVDGNPPLFYLMEWVVANRISNENIGYRLLPVLGFVGTLFLMYVFVKRRNGRAAALIAASLLLITPLFTSYAAEARPYSLLSASVALAMVCYQRASNARWLAGLFLALFLASAVHYYGVLAFGPFLLAELTVLSETKRLRIGVWVVFLAALVPLGASWRILAHLRQQSGGHFWSSPNLNVISTSYGEFFRLQSAWGTALAGMAFLFLVATFIRTARDPERGSGFRAAPLAEQALVLGFVALPMVSYAVMRLVNGPIVDRYFLPAILGIVATAGYAASRLKPTGAAIAAAFVVIAVASQEFGFWRTYGQRDAVPAQITQITNLAEAARHSELPIVTSDAGVCLETAQFGGPELRRRVLALPDPPNAARYAGTDTPDQLVLALQPYLPGVIQAFGPFAASHPVFLLYSDGSDYDWWPARLLREGNRLQVLAVEGKAAMYLVELRPPGPDVKPPPARGQ
jgi:hypothetical protein